MISIRTNVRHIYSHFDPFLGQNFMVGPYFGAPFSMGHRKFDL